MQKGDGDVEEVELRGVESIAELGFEGQIINMVTEAGKASETSVRYNIQDTGSVQNRCCRGSTGIYSPRRGDVA